MNIAGLGTDLVEVARLDQSIDRHGDRFLHRVFTDAEIAYCAGMKSATPFYAARFAAKEAVSKALGTGIGAACGWRDIEVRRKASGEPFIVLHGAAEETARRLGITAVLISLSHTENYAIAQAIAVRGE